MINSNEYDEQKAVAISRSLIGGVAVGAVVSIIGYFSDAHGPFIIGAAVWLGTGVAAMGAAILWPEKPKSSNSLQDRQLSTDNTPQLRH